MAGFQIDSVLQLTMPILPAVVKDGKCSCHSLCFYIKLKQDRNFNNCTQQNQASRLKSLDFNHINVKTSTDYSAGWIWENVQKPEVFTY